MTWAYLPVLNECITILLTIGIGFILQMLGVFDAPVFVSQLVKFVFQIALPLHIFKGIGIGVDFYSDSFLWTYIAAFLILRVIALVGVFCWIAIYSRKDKTKGIGDVAVLWLALTWISTVILGIPILTATYGDKTKGIYYGLLAGISSFIFQLPFQLYFFECHVLEKEYFRSQSSSDVELATSVNGNAELPLEKESQNVSLTMEKSSILSHPAEPVQHTEHPRNDNISPLRLSLKFATRPDIWIKILCQLVRNSILWGIFFGFVFSLSTGKSPELHRLFQSSFFFFHICCCIL